MVKRIGGWNGKVLKMMLERRWKRKADDSKLRTVYIQWCCKATKMKITARLQL